MARGGVFDEGFDSEGGQPRVSPVINIDFGGLYEVDGELAKSRKAWIYRGRDLRTGDSVAIKVLRPCSLPGEQLERRFEQEFQLLRSLSHPNVVKVHRTGLTSNGLLYFAMELVEGETLDVKLAREGPMAPERVADLLDQIADALDQAHGFKIIHRDIGPHNILLSRDKGGFERVKILDFGLAKVIQTANEVSPGPPGSGGSHSNPGLTGDGVMVGTPEYMSPEQVRGTGLSERSDLYSLGATLYALLTGEPPFRKGTDFETMVAHVTENVPPFPNRKGGWPSGVEVVVLEALAKDPEQRPGTAGTLARMFRQSLLSTPQEAARRYENLRAERSRLEANLWREERAVAKRADSAAEASAGGAPARLMLPMIVAGLLVLIGLTLWVAFGS